MRIECIAIGTELLTSDRLDTNSVWIAQRLAELGLQLHRKTAVGDERDRMADLFREAMDRSELVVCTGGLGPTFDDLTKETWAEVLGDPLLEDASVLREIETLYATLRRPMPPANRKQALVPASARALHNPVGTAPGILWEEPAGRTGFRVVLLPGVPREMKQLWTTEIEPILRPLAGPSIRTLRLLVGSAGESALEERTAPLRARHGHLDWTILAGPGTVELVARSPFPEDLEAARRDFQHELGADLACTGEGSLEGRVLELLRSRGETLAVAESVTGGLVQARLASVPGASEVFRGGGVVYSSSAKCLLADVDPALLQAHGTVSEAAARALAEGIARRLGTPWGLATTGNAGPAEDREGPAPAGTCFIAVRGPRGTQCLAQHFPGSRSDIQARTVAWALDFLRRRILEA